MARVPSGEQGTHHASPEHACPHVVLNSHSDPGCLCGPERVGLDRNSDTKKVLPWAHGWGLCCQGSAVNYYFLRYVRWDARESRERVMEFLAPAETAADAKVFCDVATHALIPTDLSEELEWRHERMETAAEDVYRQAENGWLRMSGDSSIKRRWER